jgi:hypothetical protein
MSPSSFDAGKKNVRKWAELCRFHGYYPSKTRHRCPRFRMFEPLSHIYDHFSIFPSYFHLLQTQTPYPSGLQFTHSPSYFLPPPYVFVPRPWGCIRPLESFIFRTVIVNHHAMSMHSTSDPMVRNFRRDLYGYLCIFLCHLLIRF